MLCASCALRRNAAAGRPLSLPQKADSSRDRASAKIVAPFFAAENCAASSSFAAQLARATRDFRRLSAGRAMAALCARLATAGRASVARGGHCAATLATPARSAPAPAPCRRRDVATAAVTTADFEALSSADGAGDGSGGLAATALRLAASVLAGIPASVALDEVADREGQRVRALTNAQTAEGVRMHVSFPASVHAGEPAPVVVLIHQARRARQRRARHTAPQHAAALHRGGCARCSGGIDLLSRRCLSMALCKCPRAQAPPAPARAPGAHAPADALRCAVLRLARARNRAGGRAGTTGALQCREASRQASLTRAARAAWRLRQTCSRAKALRGCRGR